jgi:hypothetical protein
MPPPPQKKRKERRVINIYLFPKHILNGGCGRQNVVTINVFSLSLLSFSSGYFSPKRDCPRVLKFSMSPCSYNSHKIRLTVENNLGDPPPHFARDFLCKKQKRLV